MAWEIVYSTSQSMICKLFLRYVFFTQSSTLMLSGLFFYLLLLIRTQLGLTLLLTICTLSFRFLLLLAVYTHNCKIHGSTMFYFYQTLIWVLSSTYPNFLSRLKKHQTMELNNCPLTTMTNVQPLHKTGSSYSYLLLDHTRSTTYF